MICTRASEEKFWNDPKIIEYFSRKPPDPLVAERLSQIPCPQMKTVLDLGCGTGRNAISAIALGFLVHMCDPNPAMINAAAKNIASHGKWSNLEKRLVHGMMTALPYRSDAFDAIITCGVLHQANSLEEYQLAMSELSRVARQGCVVMLNVFTNMVDDPCLIQIPGQAHSFITGERLPMTLLPREIFYQLMRRYSFQLEREICEEVKIENTGPRAILRANFLKAV